MYALNDYIFRNPQLETPEQLDLIGRTLSELSGRYGDVVLDKLQHDLETWAREQGPPSALEAASCSSATEQLVRATQLGAPDLPAKHGELVTQV